MVAVIKLHNHHFDYDVTPTSPMSWALWAEDVVYISSSVIIGLFVLLQLEILALISDHQVAVLR